MRRVFFSLLIAAAALLAGRGEQAAAVNNQLQVDADTATPGIQNSVVFSPNSGAFNVQLWVANVQTRLCTPYLPNSPCGLGAYTIDLHFNKNVIRCEDINAGTPGCQNVTNGPFLTSTGRLISQCFYASGNDPDNGIIKYTCTTSGNPYGGLTPLGPNGTSGLLATLRFKPVPGAIGTSTLDLSESALTDVTATPICHPDYTPCDVQNGEVIVNYKADLSVTKTAPSSVDAPSTIDYSLSVTNGGPEQATEVSLADSLPPEVDFSSASPECTYYEEQHKVNCDLGTLTNGQNKTISITASVAADDAGKTALNTADVTTTSLDQFSSNNHAEASTQVSSSNLTITKMPWDVALGADGQYVIGVNSSGPSTAAAVVVVDTLSSYVTYHSASSTVGTCSYDGGLKKVTCNLGDIAPGTSATITIDVTFPNGTEPGLPHPDTNHPLGTYVSNLAVATWTRTGINSKSVTKYTWVGIPDTDGDGCHDYQELGSNPAKGGQRDPLNPYDFVDVPTPSIHRAGANAIKDRVVDASDTSALLVYGFCRDDGPPNTAGADYDDDKNGNYIEDGLEYDFRGRTGWGPDGWVDALDVSKALAQGFDTCKTPFT